MWNFIAEYLQTRVHCHVFLGQRWAFEASSSYHNLVHIADQFQKTQTGSPSEVNLHPEKLSEDVRSSTICFVLQIHSHCSENRHRHHSDQLERFNSSRPIWTTNHQHKGLSRLPSSFKSPNPSSSFTTCFLMRFPMSVFPNRNTCRVAVPLLWFWFWLKPRNTYGIQIKEERLIRKKSQRG